MWLTWLTATDTGRKINDILNNKYKDRDDLEDLREAVTTISQSTIRLVISVSFAVVAIAFLIAALKVGTGNPAERSEAKKKLYYGFIAAAGILLLAAIVMFIAGLADKVVAG